MLQYEEIIANNKSTGSRVSKKCRILCHLNTNKHVVGCQISDCFSLSLFRLQLRHPENSKICVD